MQIDLLGGDSLEEIKSAHDKVVQAVYSIPPHIRERYQTHPLIYITKDNAAKAKHLLIKKIKRDLELTELPRELEYKLNDLIDWSEIANRYKDDYIQIDLSGDYGGTSYVRVGMLGMQKITDNEVALAASLYCEKWIEEEHVKINIGHSVWRLENVAKFAKYELYQTLKHKLISAKMKSEL
eukprot:20403_1